MVAKAADVPHLRRLAPRGRGDAQDGLDAVPDLRHPQLRDGHGLPQVRILDARSAPTERWSGRRRRSGAQNPGPRADVSARSTNAPAPIVQKRVIKKPIEGKEGE